ETGRLESCVPPDPQVLVCPAAAARREPPRRVRSSPGPSRGKQPGFLRPLWPEARRRPQVRRWYSCTCLHLLPESLDRPDEQHARRSLAQVHLLANLGEGQPGENSQVNNPPILVR